MEHIQLIKTEIYDTNLPHQLFKKWIFLIKFIKTGMCLHKINKCMYMHNKCI